ncbi:TPR repeat protein [Cryptococcus neoformans var. grubii Br795]|uniref:TPR repeat protein n=1 Tax=Cryptococcus neoformans Tu259-1 TaxID=1230072 RepID=A0A854QF21_CRYNE|nr:TPR repeat protein [Cryptococcus neoformans var. grubii AD1-83a]OXG24188.1 TPR repeat protein [Cryptococcus neoformans var. grubii Tu259-1]OXG39393.1 TPR repeat protein [Cryptococcus neoformans var. grubii Th84]OXG42244.1 TPR repeat protein [Cryptococcus neoformans var. grubii MW-RSA1955]OXG46685.1 TPR repeat protein [Cryptococcus neoformans var. grubii CHC193]OXG55936.1 TPR repeat protein [Cryptococcus neoformans var. grubii c8]OXG71585.1 TPR repeat protein [Cryptococcus neoformans var. g
MAVQAASTGATQSDDGFLDQLIASMPKSTVPPESGVGPAAPKKEVTVEDFEKLLDSTPLFMRETPKDGDDNPVLEALRSLVFEGEGDEIATNFKNHGNELHAQKSYSEAIKAYSEGIDAHPSSATLLVTLYNNRAACQLILKNYRSALKDTSAVIALYTAGKIPQPDKALVKALFRAAQSLVQLSRWKEAGDVVERGKELAEQVKEDTKVWDTLEKEVVKGKKRDDDRVERIRRDNMTKLALRKAVEDRGLIVADTPSPPDNPHPLHFDEQSIPTINEEAGWTPPPPHTPIVFPVFLLYPTYGQSDFITHFHEDASLEDQLSAMFPISPSAPQIPWAEWDEKREYYVPNLVVYVETKERRLLKVGKELTLREVLGKARRDAKGEVKKDGVVLRDGLLSFVVLVKGAQEKAWIEEFKRKRDEKQ